MTASTYDARRPRRGAALLWLLLLAAIAARPSAADNVQLNIDGTTQNADNLFVVSWAEDSVFVGDTLTFEQPVLPDNWTIGSVFQSPNPSNNPAYQATAIASLAQPKPDLDNNGDIGGAPTSTMALVEIPSVPWNNDPNATYTSGLVTSDNNGVNQFKCEMEVVWKWTPVCNFEIDPNCTNPEPCTFPCDGLIQAALSCTVSRTPGVFDDPHLTGFYGHKYAFCDGPGASELCQGRVFNLVTEERHILNTLVGRHSGPDKWPWAGTWMMALGFRYGMLLSVEVGLRTDIEFKLSGKTGGTGGESHALPVKGGFRELLAFVRVNGQDVLEETEMVESDKTMTFSNAGDTSAATVYFPVAKHPHEPNSGPVTVITTPDMRISILIESGDIWHLNFDITLTSGRVESMHGLLGQSIGWEGMKKAAVQGSDLDYAVFRNDLIGARFRHNMFDVASLNDGAATRRSLRERAPAAAALGAGSAAGHTAHWGW
ncbi:MAG: hypothetical protein J3K34DRAFT_442926 [Monoraphidium minutum]|nr:MAG: hypothetical protein J3K34DRAFT_442926 [Monoraphidium minutum]